MTDILYIGGRDREEKVRGIQRGGGKGEADQFYSNSRGLDT